MFKKPIITFITIYFTILADILLNMYKKYYSNRIQTINVIKNEIK